MGSIRSVIAGVCALTIATVGPAASAAPPEPGTEPALGPAELELVERTQMDSRLEELTFRTPALEEPTRVRILLPAAYDEDDTRRFPVLYLLHGGTGSYRDWTEQGAAAQATASLPLIVVMPDTSPYGNYVDWWNGGEGGPPMWETYHIDQLLPWIDQEYRTTGTRDGRAVAGLSMGGGGTMHYASRHPDLFTAAAAFSGAVDTNTVPVQLLVQTSGMQDGHPFGSVYGPRPTNEVQWRGHNPWDLALNLDGLFLQLDTGNGMPGGPAPGDLGDPIEQQCHEMMTNLHRRLDELGYEHLWNDYGPGGHRWFYWQRDLRELLPRLMARFAAPAPPPDPFSYTSVDSVYGVWGWDVAIDRPETEFSTIIDASRTGFRLTGSGAATVTTAPFFAPGERLRVSVDDHGGTVEQLVTADAQGRLHVEVSLGPGNPEQQYSLAGSVWAASTGATPGEWPAVDATVSITPAPAPAGPGSPTEPDTATPAIVSPGAVETLPATGGAALPVVAVLAALSAVFVRSLFRTPTARVRRTATRSTEDLSPR